MLSSLLNGSVTHLVSKLDIHAQFFSAQHKAIYIIMPLIHTHTHATPVIGCHARYRPSRRYRGGIGCRAASSGTPRHARGRRSNPQLPDSQTIRRPLSPPEPMSPKKLNVNLLPLGEKPTALPITPHCCHSLYLK